MVKGIYIDFSNLTEEEQVNLWFTIYMFADVELPDNKTLTIGVRK